MFRDTSAQDVPLAGAAQRRRRLPWIAAAAAVVLAVAAATPGIGRLFSAQSSISAARLDFATVERGDFNRDIVAEARVVAAVSPTLYAPSAGTVSFKVHAGDKVQRDQVLATLDSPELVSRLAQEQAALAAAEVDYEGAQLQARKQQLTVQEAFERAQVDEQTATREVERSQKAYDEGAYSELAYLRAKDAAEKARFELVHAHQQFTLEPEQIRFDVQSKKLARDRQQLQVAELQRQVDALSLRSPVTGQVGQVIAIERASVARDAPLLTVVDLTALELEMKVTESLARDLAVGMPARISGAGRDWDGQVSAVAPEVVNGEVAARVRFAGAAPDGLRQNQRLQVRVVLDQRKDVLMVARGSWLDTEGGHYAYVVKDGMAERRAISAGASSLDKVEILDGLQPGERIVSSGTDLFNNAPRVIISR
ncbi:MAG: efflux RND transporter periplasmic adaptor subunit [Nevskia sp.]|nr:efflux RND transporter periplasmic adaptor subunit [Nevskia sp.]